MSATAIGAQSFVGRSRELVELQRLLGDSRLVTLTGVGGVGKTRLALQVSAAIESRFPDGVWPVELGGLIDPDSIPAVVAAALPLCDVSSRPVVDVLTEYLTDRHLLLVLDSCQPYIEACAGLAEVLLRSAAGLKILATSTESLGVVGERSLTLGGLPVFGVHESPAEIEYCDAAVLFADRAAAALPGFALTRDNEHLVVTVCRRFGGIPLAIELAAAQLSTHSLEHLATGSDSPMAPSGDKSSSALGTGATMLSGHQALRSAIGRSMDSCETQERLALIRLAMFPFDFDLLAADVICTDEQIPAGRLSQLVARLVAKALLLTELRNGQVRYRMLETVHDFARELLETLGERQMLGRRHRDYYLELAERFNADWFGPRQVEWTKRMRADLPNIRTALDFCFSDEQEAHFGLRLAGQLYYLWFACGEVREGVYWLERALAAVPGSGPDRFQALGAYGMLRVMQGELGAAVPCAQELLDQSRVHNQPYYTVWALTNLGVSVAFGGDLAAGTHMLEQAVSIVETIGETDPVLSAAKTAFAMLLAMGGDPSQAEELLSQSRAFCQAHEDQWWRAMVLSIAEPAVALGDIERAAGYITQALRLRRDLHDPLGVAGSLEHLAWITTAAHDYRRAARLLGAADRQWKLINQRLYGAPQWLQQHQQCEARLRDELGNSNFEAEFGHGVQMAFDDAIAFALLPD